MLNLVSTKRWKSSGGEEWKNQGNWRCCLKSPTVKFCGYAVNSRRRLVPYLSPFWEWIPGNHWFQESWNTSNLGSVRRRDQSCKNCRCRQKLLLCRHRSATVWFMFCGFSQNRTGGRMESISWEDSWNKRSYRSMATLLPIRMGGTQIP